MLSVILSSMKISKRQMKMCSLSVQLRDVGLSFRNMLSSKVNSITMFFLSRHTNRPHDEAEYRRRGRPLGGGGAALVVGPAPAALVPRDLRGALLRLRLRGALPASRRQLRPLQLLAQRRHRLPPRMAGGILPET
jgi:hypothetical protein